MSDDVDDSVDEALANRFGSGDSSQADSTSETTKVSQTTETHKTSQTSKKPLGERSQILFYLTEGQADRLDLVTDEVQLNCKREFGVELEKNRHVRPLVLALGLERVEEMDATAIRDAVRDRGALDWPTE